MGVDFIKRLENHRVLAISGATQLDCNYDLFVSGTLYCNNLAGSLNVAGFVPYVNATSGLEMGTHHIKTTGSISAGSFIGNLYGDVDGNISGAGLSYLGSLAGTTGSWVGIVYAGSFYGSTGSFSSILSADNIILKASNTGPKINIIQSGGYPVVIDQHNAGAGAWGALFFQNITASSPTGSGAIYINANNHAIKAVAGLIESTDGFDGNLTGNVTGNLTGDVTGNVTGSLVGSVFGNVNGNISGAGLSSFGSIYGDNLQILNTTHTNPNTTYKTLFHGTTALMTRATNPDNYIIGNLYYNTSNQWIHASSGGGVLIGLNTGGSGPGNISFYTSTPAVNVAGSIGSATIKMMLSQVGKLGIGTQAPSAFLHLPSGGTAATSAPLKLTIGSLLTATEAGAIEYDGTNLYFTNNAGTRNQLAVV